jgi:hypothetical protein
MAGTRARRLQIPAAYGYLRPLVMRQSADRVRLLMVQTFIYSKTVMWRGSVGHDEGGQRQDVSGREKLSTAF